MADSTQGPRPSGPAPVDASSPRSGDRAEHAADRWARWETARGRTNAAGTRRLLVIAAIVALGVIVWLLWMH